MLHFPFVSFSSLFVVLYLASNFSTSSISVLLRSVYFLVTGLVVKSLDFVFSGFCTAQLFLFCGDCCIVDLFQVTVSSFFLGILDLPLSFFLSAISSNFFCFSNSSTLSYKLSALVSLSSALNFQQ